MKYKYKFRIISVIVLLVILNLGTNIINTEELNNSILEDSNINSNIEYKYVTVKQGDSIWSLVSENMEYINKSSYIDFKDVVNYTIELNGGSDINIGETIVIPLNI